VTLTTVPPTSVPEPVNLDELGPEDRREFLDVWSRWRSSLRWMTDGSNGDCIPLAIAILSRELAAALERIEELEERVAALSYSELGTVLPLSVLRRGEGGLGPAQTPPAALAECREIGRSH
jgi:hypothetical protein